MYNMREFYERALANTEYRYLRDASDVKLFVNNDRKCFCYGAGDFGKRFARYCKKHNLELGGFVISDNQSSEKLIMNLPVYHLSEIVMSDNIRIVVAVRENLHIEIANELIHYKERSLTVKYLCDIPQFLIDDFDDEVKERSALDIFKDYGKIAEEFYNPITREHGYNSCYGHARMMKKLLGISLNTAFPDSILHGIGWTGNLIFGEIDYNNFWGNKVYVSGKCWKDYLSYMLPHKEIIDIGNYMRYVSSIYSKEKMNQYKQSLGRTLLVFPYHSIKNSEISFDVNSFIEEIENRKKNFDSVMVCMYYYDIQLNREKPFQEKGYKIVTAGHVLDYNFTHRLRSIIELSDVTMSNHTGTHLAYSVCLGKPHYLFTQRVHFYCEDAPGEESKKEFDNEGYDKDYNGRYNFNSTRKEPSETSKLVNLVEKYFSEWKEKLTKEQIRIVEDIWGNMNSADKTI